MASSRCCAWLRSRRGSSSQHLSMRLPMPVMQVSSSENSVGASSPRSVCTSSRLRRVVTGRSISSSSRCTCKALHVRQRAALGVLGVGQQRRRGGVGMHQFLGAPGGQGGAIELLQQLAQAQAGVELPLGPLA